MSSRTLATIAKLWLVLPVKGHQTVCIRLLVTTSARERRPSVRPEVAITASLKMGILVITVATLLGAG